jgi:hypothetical protein
VDIRFLYRAMGACSQVALRNLGGQLKAEQTIKRVVRHSKPLTLMSALGHSRRWPGSATSAPDPLATVLRVFQKRRYVPKADIGRLIRSPIGTAAAHRI